ncbi:Sec20-domain-containing protein [Obelidium mucronatum]|nr:Sec20-domain-containing protein [Obelidium mucronatum]
MSVESIESLLCQATKDLAQSTSQLHLDKVQRTVTSALDDLKELRLECDESDIVEKERINDIEGRFVDLRTSIRKAKLTLKESENLRKRDERQQLLSSPKPNNDRSAHQKVEQAKMAANDLTESMREAAKMMQDEVEKSVAAVQALEASTQMLEKTRAQYTTYESVLSLSSNILKEIHRGSIMDKLVLFGGFGVFLLVVLYIVWKRTWIPGLSMLIGKKNDLPLATIKSITTTVASAAKTVTTTVASKHHSHNTNHMYHNEL